MAQISTSSRDAASLLNQNEIVAIPGNSLWTSWECLQRESD
jgi:hypothetical protein